MKFYLSHAIRGQLGMAASNTQMLENCKKAITIANYLRTVIKPSIEIYVPGEHEFPLVNILITKGFITIRQILEADCIVIDGCDAILVYVPKGDELQGGRLVEVEHAKTKGIPAFVFSDVNELLSRLVNFILRA